MLKTLASALPVVFALGCHGPETPAEDSTPSHAPSPASATGPAPKKQAQAAAPEEKSAPEPAALGKTAPDFALPDLDGKTVRLEDFKGKLVVLEWFNPECPYVKAAHTAGSLVDTAATLQKRGVTYLAINSGGAGRQGHGAEKNIAGKKKFSLDHPILLDEDGTVGKAYGATNTPHIFIVDDEGVLVYRGAVDNSPDGEGQSPAGGKLTNYLTQAVDELQAGKPVSMPETKAYGCSVKYTN